MWLYRGRRVLVTLDDGSAVRGRLGWSWAWGVLRVNEPESLDGDAPVEIPGFVLIPRRRVLIAQVQ